MCLEACASFLSTASSALCLPDFFDSSSRAHVCLAALLRLCLNCHLLLEDGSPHLASAAGRMFSTFGALRRIFLLSGQRAIRMMQRELHIWELSGGWRVDWDNLHPIQQLLKLHWNAPAYLSPGLVGRIHPAIHLPRAQPVQYASWCPGMWPDKLFLPRQWMHLLLRSHLRPKCRDLFLLLLKHVFDTCEIGFQDLDTSDDSAVQKAALTVLAPAFRLSWKHVAAMAASFRRWLRFAAKEGFDARRPGPRELALFLRHVSAGGPTAAASVCVRLFGGCNRTLVPGMMWIIFWSRIFVSRHPAMCSAKLKSSRQESLRQCCFAQAS